MSAIDLTNQTLNGTSTDYSKISKNNVVSKTAVDNALEKIKYCIPGTYLYNNECKDCGLGYYRTGGSHRAVCTYGAISCYASQNRFDPELPVAASGKINKILTLDEVNSLIPATDISQWEKISNCNRYETIPSGCSWFFPDGPDTAIGCDLGSIGPGTYMFAKNYENTGYAEEIAVFDHAIGYKSLHICNFYDTALDTANSVYKSYTMAATLHLNTGSSFHNTNVTNATLPSPGIAIFKLK
jgi:hypothetical protein